jgi:cobalt/nickel transport system permease protein
MSDVINSIYSIRFLDEAASKKTIIHKIDPIAKLLVTIIYLIVVVSFKKYDIIGLIPYLLYLVVTFLLSEVPFIRIFKRLIIILPFIIGIGIFNPLFDTRTFVVMGGVNISGGWVSFLSLIIKCSLTVLAGLLLIATTGIEKIASALRRLHIPKIFVTQFLLTYRYISVLLNEAAQVIMAYHLRAPMEKAVSFKASGSLLGQMLLRAFDRANRVYNAMILRGFNGEYAFGEENSFSKASIIYIILWTGFFITAKFLNLPESIGRIITGVLM